VQTTIPGARRFSGDLGHRSSTRCIVSGDDGDAPLSGPRTIAADARVLPGRPNCDASLFDHETTDKRPASHLTAEIANQVLADYVRQIITVAPTRFQIAVNWKGGNELA
jgi:hypothetical protein